MTAGAPSWRADLTWPGLETDGWADSAASPPQEMASSLNGHAPSTDPPPREMAAAREGASGAEVGAPLAAAAADSGGGAGPELIRGAAAAARPRSPLTAGNLAALSAGPPPVGVGSGGGGWRFPEVASPPGGPTSGRPGGAAGADGARPLALPLSPLSAGLEYHIELESVSSLGLGSSGRGGGRGGQGQKGGGPRAAAAAVAKRVPVSGSGGGGLGPDPSYGGRYGSIWPDGGQPRYRRPRAEAPPVTAMPEYSPRVNWVGGRAR